MKESTKRKLKEVPELLEIAHLTIKDILGKVYVSRGTFYKWYNKNYSKEYQRDRKRITYRNSKLGDKNPMKGNSMNRHPHWKGGEYTDKDGYVLTKKIPDWYKGDVRSNGYVLKHKIIACKKLNIKRIPEGSDVHHIDNDKQNNHEENLEVLAHPEHISYHARRRNDYPTRE